MKALAARKDALVQEDHADGAEGWNSGVGSDSRNFPAFSHQGEWGQYSGHRLQAV